MDAIFTLYSDRDYLEIPASSPSPLLDSRGVTARHSVIKIPIVTALPRWLNNLFRRADETKPRLISSIIDYRNLMPLFPELMKILSWKLNKRITDYGLRITNKDNKTSSFKKKSAIRNSQSNNSIILISSYAVAKNIDMPV